GQIDKALFEKAWNNVIAANEMLRTQFRWEKVEQPLQIHLKEYKLQPEYYQLSEPQYESNVPLTGSRKQTEHPDHKNRELEKIQLEDREKGFNLQEVPFRVTLCKQPENKNRMIISNHHILYDGWSNGIILKEFFEAYNALAAGKEPVKPEKQKIKEFVKTLHRQDKIRQKEYWQENLKGIETGTELTIKGRNRRGKTRPGSITRNWGKALM
ncbi:MAG: hypothetical protein GY757_12730, partial [bacterium]|nr:hypothetical protein [bacterium]